MLGAVIAAILLLIFGAGILRLVGQFFITAVVFAFKLVCVFFGVLAALCFVLFPAALMLTDYVVVLLFCGYVGFDWARAQQYPKTLDNAIDCAADIYVDIINLFIRILSIIARSKKN